VTQRAMAAGGRLSVSSEDLLNLRLKGVMKRSGFIDKYNL